MPPAAPASPSPAPRPDACRAAHTCEPHEAHEAHEAHLARDAAASMVPAHETPTGGTVVVVPVKTFAVAKHRLSPALDARARVELAQTMAAHVLRIAAAHHHVIVVVPDDDTAAWAAAQRPPHSAHRFDVVLQARPGLNGAVEDALDHARRVGHARAVVTHADLPRLRDLTRFHHDDAAVAVLGPDARHDGTNVLSVALAADFVPEYGQGSFARHRAQLLSLGLRVVLVEADDVAADVDTPQDLPHTAP